MCSTSGAAVAEAIRGHFPSLSAVEEVAVERCAATADRIAAIENEIEIMGAVVDGGANGLLVELRQQEALLAKLLTSYGFAGNRQRPRFGR